MNQIPSNWKQCATCAFWMGPRTSDNFGSAVYLDISSCGMCAIPSGGWKGAQKPANTVCGDYQKWPVLK